MTTRDTPETALAAALDKVVENVGFGERFSGALIVGQESVDDLAAAILAALDGWTLAPSDVLADAERWREAEAEGHIVTFSAVGYGLQHPPSCRPDLIGCRYNRYLASKSKADRRPGRYRMMLDNMVAKYARAAIAPSEP